MGRIFGLIACSLLLVPFSFAHAQLSNVSDKDRAVANADAAVRSITADLREARGMLKKITDRDLRDRLELLIGRAELQLGDLQKELPSVATTAKPQGMGAEDFARMLKALKGQSFDDNKLTFIKGLGKTVAFSSAQVKEMLTAFSFDERRIEAAVMLYPQISDPVNFYLALEVFTFDSQKNTVREKLNLK